MDDILAELRDLKSLALRINLLLLDALQTEDAAARRELIVEALAIIRADMIELPNGDDVESALENHRA